jgi:hypothetical protein
MFATSSLRFRSSMRTVCPANALQAAGGAARRSLQLRGFFPIPALLLTRVAHLDQGPLRAGYMDVNLGNVGVDLGRESGSRERGHGLGNVDMDRGTWTWTWTEFVDVVGVHR